MSEWVPATLPVVANLRRLPAARSWLDELPELIEQVRRAYRLRLSPPLHGGSCSWVAPAELPDGTPAIVKIGWPHPEMYGEPVALRLWNGRGAVRLLAHDPDRHALLLQRCQPGTELATDPAPADDRLRAGCEVLRKLWQAPLPEPGDDIPRLAPVTAGWADLAADRMARLRPGYDPGLVADGIELLRTLPATADRTVLLHGDANPGNILSTSAGTTAASTTAAGTTAAGSVGNGGWLAIDPKPMVGDPAYDPWPLLEQIDDPFTHSDPVRTLRRRLALLADELELEPDRIRRWALARLVEWALWAAEHDDTPGGSEAMTSVGLLARA
ncbi:aminoglycoside phosphotransferase family protein [Solwaraspora sp. WMMD1047]|uniref:aminoglycoside phosphotransferase family protein n=1 Tax=Solwaraspora sp. WMMD1047 TaxID=3016102 RepID=UPI002416FB91|nr:aminoglycoside phosphotransferase family protein [Solwaraspora sp. WMMD1047]MDG4829151.1 aminoglycoside phosphotransferase family protein [Solwaraspora sp. WMMD1047]